MRQAGTTLFHRAIAELSDRLDRVIIGNGPYASPAMNGPIANGDNFSLVLITPEMRSVLAAAAIQESVSADLNTWFLLNRFDNANPRHDDIRHQLRTRLGEHLLPFCIPETSLVEDAMAQGVPVIDLAPQSQVADAFFELAEWYRAKSAVEVSNTCTSEETQLAVCDEI
jgi:cellulose biosynthesis protein BcsQ